MTLQNNEVVYTADLMNIAPSNDAQIYGMSGNWILNGLSVVSSNATSIILSAGRAIIQGRLFELKANTEYAVNSRAGFIGLNIDLTQTNSEDNAGLITNNQFTVGFGASEFGDTLQGDVEAFVGLYAVDGKGGYTKHTLPYMDSVDLTNTYGDFGFPADTSNQRPTVRRIGKNVQVNGILNNKYTVSAGQHDLVLRNLPYGFRPNARLYGTFPSAGGVYEISINTNGDILFTNYSGRDFASKRFISITFNFMIE